MNPRPLCLAAVAALAAVACSNYQDQLARAELHYRNARYEAALANLEDLEIHTTDLARPDRVRYDVVRGMTHLRLEQRGDARHWLALAREEAQGQPGALTEASRGNIEQALAQLDPLNPAPASDAGATGSGSEDAGSTATPPTLSR
jgi:hypothetical protein